MEFFVSEATYDVVAIGNAIVDILSQADDAFIVEQGMTKGSMALMFSPADADALYAKMGPGREVSGGVNPLFTMAGDHHGRRQDVSAALESCVSWPPVSTARRVRAA